MSKTKTSEQFTPENSHGDTHLHKLDEIHKNCKKAYKAYQKQHPDQETGNLLAIYDVLDFLHKSGLSGERDWFYEALLNIIEDMIVKGSGLGKGRHKNTRKQYISHFIDFRRYETVKDHAAQQFTLTKSFELAHQSLIGTFAQGSERTMKDSYYKVLNLIDKPEGRDLYINFPKSQRVLAGIDLS